uniref:Uncharacterized protein n=1 Tax=Anguilla anguilla TaxID=7936 RepID=A0A0E9U1U1_ANGAN
MLNSSELLFFSFPDSCVTPLLWSMLDIC